MFEYQCEDLHHQMHRFLEYVSQPHSFVKEIAQDAWQPNVDVYETQDAVVVLVELAGVTEQSIDIAVKGRVLHLTGSRGPRFHKGCRQFSRLEIAYGRFERAIELPVFVDQDAGEARADNGILEIVLPVQQPFRPRIQTTSGQKQTS